MPDIFSFVMIAQPCPSPLSGDADILYFIISSLIYTLSYKDIYDIGIFISKIAAHYFIK